MCTHGLQRRSQDGASKQAFDVELDAQVVDLEVEVERVRVLVEFEKDVEPRKVDRFEPREVRGLESREVGRLVDGEPNQACRSVS